MNYTTKDPFWVDEKGTKVEYKRTTPYERLKERRAKKLSKKAHQIHKLLAEYKELAFEVNQEVYDKYMEENNNANKERKGNFTWGNFDKSIKMEVSVNEPIKLDDLAVIACKQKLDEFLDKNVDSKQDVVKEMILDAFETSRGKLDTKKVLSLLSYKNRINDKLFHEALDMLEKGITRPKSKKYFRIWEQDNEGVYQNIDLNLSSI